MNEYRNKILALCNQKPHDFALDKLLQKINSYEIKVIFGGGGVR